MTLGRERHEAYRLSSQQRSSLSWKQKQKQKQASQQQRLQPLFLITNENDNDESLQISNSYQINIEYCSGCRWGLRAFWMAQELLTTFANDVEFQCVTILPSRPPLDGGRYIVQCIKTSSTNNNGPHIYDDSSSSTKVLWNRSEQGRFPELKELKQLVRDEINPSKYLGHSDMDEKKKNENNNSNLYSQTNQVDMIIDNVAPTIPFIHGSVSPNIAFLYCTGCRWLLRAAYYGQELMSTFPDEINSITFIPSRPPITGGSFLVALDQNQLVWDRAHYGRFPETKELKQSIRNNINPNKNLGHSDVNKTNNININDDNTVSTSDGGFINDELDDEQAEAARKFFGVM